MVLWHLGLVYGLTLLNSGRAAIIGYTMPVWTLLASVVLYAEKLSGHALLAVASSLTATLLLAHDGALARQRRRVRRFEFGLRVRERLLHGVNQLGLVGRRAQRGHLVARRPGLAAERRGVHP